MCDSFSNLTGLKPEMISDELLAAYRATHFCVSADSPFVLRVGQYSRELEELHVSNNIDSSVFITAFNPLSEPCTLEQNRSAQAQLFKSVEQLGYSWIDGEGKDPEGVWPGEPSILVLGCTKQQGDKLGQKFGQNAFLWAGETAVPELGFNTAIFHSK